MKNILFLALILIAAIEVSSNVFDKTCPYLPACVCNNTTLFCSNFSQFKDLNFKIPNKNTTAQFAFEYIRITPQIAQALNEFENILDLAGLKIHPYSTTVELENIKSFSLNANPFKAFPYKISLKITNSVFEFYNDNQTLNKQCETLATNERTWAISNSASFIYLINVTFSEPLCPSLFNFNLLHLFITNPMGDLTFLKINKYESFKSSINYLTIENASFKQLNDEVLDKHVFSSLKGLTLRNVKLGAIKTSLFANFKHINKLDLDISNWNDFIHKSDMSWLREINIIHREINFTQYIDHEDLKSVNLLLNVKTKNYSFPQEDFCIFSQIPLNRMVSISLKK